MFAKIIKTAALSAMLALGGIGAVATTAATSQPAAAQASFEFRFGNAPIVRHRHAPPRYARNYCDPRQAVHKASRMGVHRAHVVRNAPRRVAVKGFSRGHPVRLVFANQRGCPIIASR
ncbi:hypothetical protein [Pararhizobium haloflavum]|uniref:hypothetical protein n=1 Tax=Pararhizobium haloflavum TaxID=2037914 RepID=UPI000C17AC38|nr:hypothetical protein [Pararhizobium haloflavum]